MLIFLLILGVVLFAVVTIGMNHGKAKVTMVTLSLIILLGALTLFTVNDVSYWGMKETTKVTYHPLNAATNIEGTPALLYKSLGNGKEKVFIYKTNKDQKKVQTTKAEVTTKNKFVRSSAIQHPTLTTKTYEYVYKNNFYKVLFAGINGNHRYIRQVNTFKTPNSWVALSTDQVSQLQKQAKKTRKATKSQLTQVIGEQVQQAKTQNPGMTVKEQKQLVKAVTAKVKAQMAQEVATKLQGMSLE